MEQHRTRTLAEVEKLRAAGVANTSEIIALLALYDNGPMHMSLLGEAVPLSRAAVTTLTDRLEQDGLVKRFADSKDRRRTEIVLTFKAERLMDKALA